MNREEMLTWLHSVRGLDSLISAKLTEVARLKEQSVCIGSSADGERVQKSKAHKAPYEDTVIRYADLEAEINEEIEELVKAKKEIRLAISKLSNCEMKTVLNLRYICMFRWSDIAEEMEYGLRSIHRLHEKALDSLEKSIKK